jgi:UDP-GlcNAc:undecaprenyl-phosphate GlcNAc-1-phosphate transferase
MTAIGGTLSLVYQQSEYALISIVSVIVFLFVGKVFGIAEFQLIANRSRALARSFVIVPHRGARQFSHHDSVRLQGDKNWESCWQFLREFAQTSGVQHLTMDLNLPWLHESYHAKYNQLDRKKVVADELWTAEIPLRVEGRVIGRLDFSGNINDSSFFKIASDLMNVLAVLEPHFRETIASVAPLPHNEDEAYRAVQEVEFGLESPDVPVNQELDVH